MEKVFGGNPITITETAEVPISIYAPDVLLKTQENKNFPHHTKHAHTKKKKTHLTKTNRNITLNQKRGILYFTFSHFPSFSQEANGGQRTKLTGKVPRRRK